MSSYFSKVFVFVFSCLVLVSSRVSVGSQGKENATVIDLGSRLELFVDDFLIERMASMDFVLQVPIDEGPILYFDRPWEGPFCAYGSVIEHNGLIRFYYRGRQGAGRDGDDLEVTCCAESDDGIEWRRPKLSLFEACGTRENNVVLAEAAPVTHNFAPLLDTRPGVLESEQFKALGGNSKTGLFAYVSPDGIHWDRMRDEPVITEGAFDSQNVAFWSETEALYACYLRTWTSREEGRIRTISRSTSTDFLNWTDPVQVDFGDTPMEHLYTNGTRPYFRAPHIYVAIAARFMPGRQVVADDQAETLGVDPRYYKDCSDAVLMTSRGGTRFDRAFMEGFVRPGIGLENWVSRTNYPVLGVIQTSPTEMSIYVNQDYAQPTSHVCRYSMRLDGFASVRAPYGGGELTTKPLTFRGSKLLLNFATSAAGGIRVEIQDVSGQPLEGFALEDCREIIGNEIERSVIWENGKTLAELQGETVRLRFVMKDASLFALRFN